MRCARTDANVHAACNLISLKLILDPPSLEVANPAASLTGTPPTSATEAHYSKALVAHLNQFLPPHIRVWGFYRVLGAFQPRRMCESRTYEYSVPTYVFLPPKPGSVLHERLKEYAGWATGQEPGAGGEVGEEATWWQGQAHDRSFAADLEGKRAFRVRSATRPV